MVESGVNELDDKAARLHNDDLLTHEVARERARSEYPRIFHVLSDPHILETFKPVDDAANRAKRRSHGAGMLALALALLSLATITAEPAWHGLPVPLRQALVIVAAAAALAAVWIATVGILYGRRKRDWLHNRLFTERLRQLHFQSFIWRLPEIARSMDGTDGAVERFCNERKSWLAAYATLLRGNIEATLCAMLNPNQQARPFIFDVGAGNRPDIPNGFDPDPLFKAYKTLRIDAQIGFSEYKLADSSWSLDPRRMSLRMQQKQFAFIWTLALTLLVLLHLLVIAGAIGAGMVAEGTWMHIVIIWLALLALGVKTLQEGLGLRAELARYEEYRAEVSDIRIRFELAAGQEAKLDLMMEMERVAFREMRDFLRTHHEATFLL